MVERLQEAVRDEGILRSTKVDSRGWFGDRPFDPIIDEAIRKQYGDVEDEREANRLRIQTKYNRVFIGGTDAHDPNKPFGSICWRIGYGWDSLVEVLAQRLDFSIDYFGLKGEEIPKIKYMKEKYGGLRVYSEGGRHAPNYIGGAFHYAECMSRHMCERCGSPAKLCRYAWNIHTLCPSCAQAHGYTPLPDDEQVRY